jgi:hypothetical protein
MSGDDDDDDDDPAGAAEAPIAKKSRLYAGPDGDESWAAADRFSAAESMAESAFAAYSRDFGSARSPGPGLRGFLALIAKQC